MRKTEATVSKGDKLRMKREEINIRDPYVLVHDGKYYLYGTRSATAWTKADGFDCYVSSDLREFEGPIEIFHRPEGFFSDQNYWAPECYAYNGAYYFVTTLGAEDRTLGIYVLKSGSPTGPFEFYADRLTPEEWNCIDGTLYFEGNRPYLIFSRSQQGAEEGDFCLMELSADLKHAVSEPFTLFKAKDAPWAKPFPFSKEEFGIDVMYFSDGPNLLKLEDGRLYMILSSWSVNGYAVGVAVSEQGVKGPWALQDEPLYPENGGHGMFFKDVNGRLLFTLHYPNDKYMERPTFWTVKLENGMLKLGEQV